MVRGEFKLEGPRFPGLAIAGKAADFREGFTFKDCRAAGDAIHNLCRRKGKPIAIQHKKKVKALV